MSPVNKALIFASSVGLAACATQSHYVPEPSVSQRAFFPDAYTYSVGDFILSLPVGYYEFAMQRLQFAQNILRDGSPKPVAEQKRYLVLPEYALAPRREFLLLDQRHLLIFDHAMDLEGGYPPQLTVLRRDGDASWSNVSETVLPKWSRQPSKVTIEPATGLIHVSSSSHPEPAILRWQDGRIESTNSSR
jgi:hypothetical protein